MRLINADSLKKTLRDWISDHWTEAFTGDDAGSEFVDMIDHEETIDAAKVVHAHWIRTYLAQIRTYLAQTGSYQTGSYKCSNCGRLSMGNTNYCGGCGARMDEETEK